jgi:hypothetical protein
MNFFGWHQGLVERVKWVQIPSQEEDNHLLVCSKRQRQGSFKTPATGVYVKFISVLPV